MADVTMRDLLEAGAHFGHRTRFWNPKMAPYIYGTHNGIHIINLERTLPLLREALNFIGQVAAADRDVLFVGTKKSAQDVIVDAAQSCGQPYVDKRWLGGMLTNYQTIRRSLARLDALDALIQTGRINNYSKKERLMIDRERTHILDNLGGVRRMRGIPGALFIVDVGHEHIAVLEARKLGIPVIGIVDTNHNPDATDMIIPGNDDSARAIALYANAVADTIRNARTAANLDSEETVKVSSKSQVRSEIARKRSQETKHHAAQASEDADDAVNEPLVDDVDDTQTEVTA